MEVTLTEEIPKPSNNQTASGPFDTDYLRTDLKGRSIRGGVATMGAQAAKFVLRTGSLAVLARLLTPADFGIIAMITAVTNFAMMFRDLGLSTATIQRAEINDAQISTLFWINAAIGFAVAVLTMALAPAIAWFYGEPQLIAVTMALAGAFVLAGLTVQHQALLRRHMRFLTLAVIEVVALLVGIVTAIVAAWLGAEYWSLVFMQLATAASIAVGVWLASGWCPGRPRLHCGVRRMLAFGRDITGFRAVNYFARNSDKILIGRFYGSAVLGLYSKAYSLLMLPISQIRGPLTSVAIPALSRIQDEPRRYTSYYTKLILLLSFVSMPVVVFLAVCSESLIHLLLGDQWLGASRIFQILAIAAFIQPVSTTAGVVVLSLGQSGRLLKIGILDSFVIVLSFVVGLRWGAVGVAGGYAVANYLILLPMLWYCFRLAPISVTAFLKAVARPVVASVAMAPAMLLGRIILTDQPHIAVITACLVVGFCAYLLVWSLMPGGLQLLRDFKGYVALLSAKKPKDSDIEP